MIIEAMNRIARKSISICSFCFLATKATGVFRSIPSIQQIFYALCKTDEQTMHNFYEYVYCLIETFC
jgi:hypothetical protein